MLASSMTIRFIFLTEDRLNDLVASLTTLLMLEGIVSLGDLVHRSIISFYDILTLYQ